MRAIKLISLLGLVLAGNAWAQNDCNPFSPEETKVVDRGQIKTVIGPLARFDPCHRSVQLNRPTLFAKNQGEKPPLVIIIHGGGGLGGYEREFGKLMNQEGFATLLFDAFEMNGLTSGSDLLLYQMTNGGRQRMLFKAAVGAFEWVLKSDKIDTNKIFIQGLSNGGSVAINTAAAFDRKHLRGVIAEGAPSTGIGFPNQINVPLLLVYGSADNYGGNHPKDLMHLRSSPCGFNDHYRLAPTGFSEACNRMMNPEKFTPSPQSWFEDLKTKGFQIQMELVEGGGHGMLFSDYTSSSRQLQEGRVFYRAHGASADARQKLTRSILNFIESNL